MVQHVRQGHHGLARGLELGDRGFDFVKRGETDPPQVSRVDDQSHNPVVVRSPANGPRQVTETGFGTHGPSGLFQRNIQRCAAVFLHDVALRAQDQRGVRLDDQRLVAVDERKNHEVEDKEEDEVQDHLARTVYEVPETEQYSRKKRFLGRHGAYLGTVRLFYVPPGGRHNG